jgi:hypothetical protein
LSGQGRYSEGPHGPPAALTRVPLGEITSIRPGLFEKPGVVRLRLKLEASPERGWANPDIRSIWSGQAETNWASVEIVRR